MTIGALTPRVFEFALLMQAKLNETFPKEVCTDNQQLMERMVATLTSDDEDQLITTAMLAMLIHESEGPLPGQLILADGEDSPNEVIPGVTDDIGDDKE